jgi:hypothetical protein
MNSDPSASEQNKELRRTCEILESIASRFELESAEYAAIRDAASAYTFVNEHRAIRSAYQRWKQAGGGELTPQMNEVLRSMGIDPDVANEESRP